MLGLTLLIMVIGVVLPFSNVGRQSDWFLYRGVISVVSGDLVELLRVDAGRETMVHEAVYSLVINRDDGSSDFYLIICSRLLVCHVAHG